MTQKTSVVIYASFHLHADAWQALLQEEAFLRVVAATDNLEQVERWGSGKSRVAVLVDVPRPTGELASRAAQNLAGAGLLFLVDSYNLEAVMPLIQAGANGCIARDESRARLVRSLIAVGRDELALPEEVASEVLIALARDQLPGDGLSEDLTQREREVLDQLAMGSTNKDIAQALMISVRTVEAHLRSVYAKLNVSSRTEAVLWAVQNGYGVGADM
ncbi:MAG: response regulator transcription factor [Anaerolineales bacterium]|jgi:DNA-binding NarL/FixJ family response regulator